MNDTLTDRWATASAAFKEEHPWCGWTLAFAHHSDTDTVSSFGITERLMNINLLLTTADGRSRPVMILDTQAQMSSTDKELCQQGIEVTELDTDRYEPMKPEHRELVRYEDIREIVVF